MENAKNSAAPEPIAIVGMDCIFPGAPDLHSFWKNIVLGRDCLQEIPASRWQLNDRERVSGGSRGGFIPEPIDFDCARFGIAPSEVEQGDPEQFLVLLVLHRALRDVKSGVTQQSVKVASPERTEIVLGRGGYIANGAEQIYLRTEVIEQITDAFERVFPEGFDKEISELRDSLIMSLRPVTSETVACAMPNLTSGRAANCLNAMGQNYTIDAACASSLLAVEQVMAGLREGRCDLGIAAGVHFNQKPAFWRCFKTLGALSASGGCRPFSADADGLTVGEGIGALVLKRLSDAERDNDRIYAVIRSVGVASDGRGTSIMAPRLEGQVLALRRAYEQAAVDPNRVGLIEAHGTATSAGDSTEIDTLHSVFGQTGASIALGSVKSMIGHAMPAAGMAGMIKTALSIYQRVLPPTLGVTKVHKKLEISRFAVNTALRPWVSPPKKTRIAGVSAFGFGGINAHAVLEEYADDSNWRALAPQNSELFFTTASSPASLADFCQALAARLETSTGESLAQLCRAELERGKLAEASNPVRLAIVARDLAELATKLHSVADRLASGTSAFWQQRSGIYYGSQRYPSKIVFLFPGIGFPGLAGGYAERLGELYLHFPEIRRNLDLVDEVTADSDGPYPLSYELFPPPRLSRDVLYQIEKDLVWSDRSPAGMNMANIASWELLKSFGIEPHALAGFSLGELSALVASGIITPDHFRGTLQKRIRGIMKKFAASSGEAGGLWAMAAVSAERAEALLRHIPNVAVTMDISPSQVFIGGDAQAVRAALDEFQKYGIWGQALPSLPMLAPFLTVHTELATPFEDEMRKLLREIPIHNPKYRVYSGTTAGPYPDSGEAAIRDMILRSITEPVHIRNTIKRLYADGYRIFIQLGAGGKMLANIENTLAGSEYVALCTDVQFRGGLEQLQHVLGHLVSLGVDVDLDRLYRDRLMSQPETRQPNSGAVRRLSLSPPRIHVPAEVAEKIRNKLKATSGRQHPATWNGERQVSLQDSASTTGRAANRNPAPTATVSHRPLTATAQLPGPQTTLTTATTALMQQFLNAQRAAESDDCQLLDRFLRIQRAAVAAFGSPHISGLTDPVSPAYLLERDRNHAPFPQSAGAPPVNRPLIGEIRKLVVGQELESCLVLDLSQHLFLRDHALLNVPSELKRIEERLPTLPLTFELEILAEAAEALAPDLSVISCHGLEAKRWICLEDRATLPITIRARRIAPREVHVDIFPEGHDIPAFSGRATLGSSTPAIPPPMEQHYDRPCPHTAEEFYSTGPMFHGPMFKLIRLLNQMSDTDIGGELVAGDPATMFEQVPKAALIFDPLLLDALQQIVGYRAFLDGWFTMPVGMSKITRFGPTPAPGSRVRASVRYRRLDARRIEADYEAYDSDGRLWIRVDGLKAWRIIGPKALTEANHKPREGRLSTPVPLGKVMLYRVRRDDLGDHKPDWMARYYLRPTEMAQFLSSQNVEWLLGRIAAKDAVRAWVYESKGLAIHPLELEIRNEADGAPRVITPDLTDLALSISHIEGEAIAVASQSRGIGVDVAEIKHRDPEFSRFAFNRDELRLLPVENRESWVHRIWAAKEAAVKAFRLGFGEIPQFRISQIESSTGEVGLDHEHHGSELAVNTWVEGNKAIALVVRD